MTTLVTADGIRLEAVWDGGDDPAAVVVLCHPHPRHGGTMNAPLIRAVARGLAARGAAVLRFNFRGVGESGGVRGGGDDEMGDVAAAVDLARRTHRGLPLGLAGWSFGAVVALGWQAAVGDGAAYVGIAPPVRGDLTPALPAPDRLAPARRRFVVGARDQFVTVEEMEEYAGSIGADVVVVPGGDHFFHFRDQRVVEAAAEWLLPGGGEGN